jgi:nitrogen-specific signal transduction histidine kinase
MTQVVTNLLNNAVKFSPSGSTITVIGCLTEQQAVIEVQDTGKGIAAEDLPQIFTLFTQAPSDEYRGGLGIGLALVKGIMDIHHGHISVSSAGVGLGSAFRIELPVYIPPAPTQSGLSDVGVLDSEQQIEVSSAMVDLELAQSAMSLDAQQEALRQLPEQLVCQLKAATQRGEVDALLTIIGQVDDINPGLAHELRRYAQNYDYDTLHTLFADGNDAVIVSRR